MKQILVPFLVFTVAIILIFVFFGGAEVYFQNILEEARTDVTYYTFLSFLVLCSDIALPVPSSIIMHFNGMVLGTFWGGLLSLVSVMISSVIGYYIGRSTQWAAKSKNNPKGNAFLNKYGVFAIIISRGIPILSESIVLICGYNRFKFKHFMGYSLLGYVPICWLYAYFGNLSNNLFLVAFSISMLLSFIAWFFGRRIAKSNVERS